MEFNPERCVNEIEKYLGKIDFEEGRASDPSLQLVSCHSVGFEKKIDKIIVHYAGLEKEYKDWTVRQKEMLDDIFETIVSDPIGDNDPNLKEFLEDIQAEYSIILPQNFLNRSELVEEMNKRIIDLSNEVHDFFGRFSNDEELQKIDKECTKRINHLKNERRTNLIYLGDLKGCGLCRHRSILFKVVCDMSGIPCRILRGSILLHPPLKVNPHVWNEVRLVQSVSHSLHSVDTMNFRDGFVPEQYLKFFMSLDEGTKISFPNEMTTRLIEQNYPENRSLDSIGNGTFGIVYEIRNGDYVNPNDFQIVKMDFAVKVFNITEKIKIIPRIEKYIEKEIENLELLRHPNIIEIIGSFESKSERNERLIIIVMKKYQFQGRNFLQNLNLHEEEKKVCVFQYFMEICKGLEFIHSNGKIHFDIKPENILVQLDEDCKRIIDVRIADFGSIKEQEFNLNLTTNPQTSEHYEDPEIALLRFLRKTREKNDPELIKAESIPFTAMSDIYSFGKLMKEFEDYYKGFPKMEKMVERCQLKRRPNERPKIVEIKYYIRSALEVIRQKIYTRNLSLDPFQHSRFSLLNQKLKISEKLDEYKKKNGILRNDIMGMEKKNKKLKKKYELQKNDMEIMEKENKKLKGKFIEIKNIFSTILSFDQFSELKRVSDFDNTSWTLLFRASRDGFSVKSFHSKCDNIKETLVIIKSDKNYVFGGFNPLKWNLKYGFHEAEGIWIFGFENNHKKIIKMDYNHNQKKARGGIYCSYKRGPFFGRDAIHISDNCNLYKTSITLIYDEYGFDKGERSSYFLNGGKKYFKVLDYEVFTKEK